MKNLSVVFAFMMMCLFSLPGQAQCLSSVRGSMKNSFKTQWRSDYGGGGIRFVSSRLQSLSNTSCALCWNSKKYVAKVTVKMALSAPRKSLNGEYTCRVIVDPTTKKCEISESVCWESKSPPVVP